jgi:Rod binding domain-containing protein
LSKVTAIATTQSTAPGAADQARSALRRAADELVGEVFYGTLLRQMRQSPLKGKYGHGGRGEEVFQGQLDSLLAARAGRAGESTLVDAVVARLERRAEAAAAYRDALRSRLEDLQNQAWSLPGMLAEVEG